MREWCRRPDFCGMLPQLLEGEDADFVACIQRIAKEEHDRTAGWPTSCTTRWK